MTVLPPGDRRHGTVGGYSNHRCRCDICKAGNTRRKREYRFRQANITSITIAELTPTPWMVDAACKGYPTEWFFAEHGVQDNNPYARAREICEGCPVRQECLDYAVGLPYGADHGCWGGTSAGERRKIRRARARVVEAQTDPFRKAIG